ncbi:hypothetical protein BH09PSE2_BH09PSE2_19740 [soil metagenome]
MIAELLTLALASGAPGASHRECFNLPRDARYDVMNESEILVSAGLRAYRITVTPNAALRDPSTNLITERTGVVCSPVELRLSAAGPAVGRTGLIVQSITRLSDAEAQELRKGQSKRSQFRR